MNTDLLTKILLGSIALGIWVVALQNFGALPTAGGQEVTVTNTVDVRGSVDVAGSVDVDEPLEVDIVRINGWRAANYYAYERPEGEYHTLGCTIR